MLFLDEPTAGVDPVSRREFWDMIYNLAGQGVSVLATTHYMDEAQFCKRIVMINHGVIVASGTPKEIIAAACPRRPNADLNDAFIALMSRMDK
jgi:ABC-2 type transport system ATP-binding protein